MYRQTRYASLKRIMREKIPTRGEWGKMRIKLASEEEAKRHVSSTRATPEGRLTQKTFPEMGQASGRL
jgi:hypothetical protein